MPSPRQPRHSRYTVLVQSLQGSVTIFCGGSFVHISEALHGRDVALDALFWNVQFRNEGQQATLITVKKHGAAIMALQPHTGRACEDPEFLLFCCC